MMREKGRQLLADFDSVVDILSRASAGQAMRLSHTRHTPSDCHPAQSALASHSPALLLDQSTQPDRLERLNDGGGGDEPVRVDFLQGLGLLPGLPLPARSGPSREDG
jgi:hypothetical protein